MSRSFLAALLVLAVSSEAAAHHVVSEYGIAWTEPLSFLELDLQAGFYDHPNSRGNWQVAALRLEHVFHPRFSAYVRAPFGRIDAEDRDPVVGVGDVELGLRALIYATRHGEFVLSGGLGFEAPTGNPRRKLGNGHFELTPFLTVSVAPSRRLAFFSLVSYRSSFGNPWRERHDPSDDIVWDDDGTPRFVKHTHGSVFDPHAARELFLRVGAAYVFDPAYVSVGVDQVVVFDDTAPRGPTTLRGELGVRPVPKLRVALGADFTVAGERRVDALARLGAAWMF